MVKHRAVILMDIELCEVLQSGESSGRPMTKEELKAEGLSKVTTVAVEGDSRDECIRKLKEKINGFRA